jgi:hypothetical protein
VERVERPVPNLSGETAMSQTDFEYEVQFKLDRQATAVAAERELRRERIRHYGQGLDPDAYPQTQDACHHPYFRHNGRCFSCGFKPKQTAP